MTVNNTIFYINIKIPQPVKEHLPGEHSALVFKH